MTLRGRGCLEVRTSDNPFFQPVSADVGKTSKDVPDWKVQGTAPAFNSHQHKVDGNFAFLYTRESDRIGGRVKKPETTELRMLSRTEFLRKRREKLQSELTEEEQQQQSDLFGQEVSAKPSAEDMLRTYRHEPKYEDPRYITSTSEHGRKAPTVATIVVDRAVRPQGFSKSFNNIKPKNTSLTTALTKSNVHTNLDPQFA